MTPDCYLQLCLYTKSFTILTISQGLYCISTNLSFIAYDQDIRFRTLRKNAFIIF